MAKGKNRRTAALLTRHTISGGFDYSKPPLSFSGAGRGGLLALRPAFFYGLFYAFQSPFRQGLEQSYCRPVNRLPEARYGGLFSGLTA